MENIHPWCVSRQLWWVHGIPRGTNSSGNVFVDETDDEAIGGTARSAAAEPSLSRDPDVLDTLFLPRCGRSRRWLAGGRLAAEQRGKDTAGAPTGLDSRRNPLHHPPGGPPPRSRRRACWRGIDRTTC